MKKQSKILFSKEQSFNEFCKSCKDRYILNEQFFFEGLKYNNCLNQKVVIDRKGKVKNCLFLSENHGNYTELETIVKTNDFQKLWKLSKDHIDVCRDCEKRYLCQDCRAFTEGGGLHSKPISCKYDPTN